MPPGYAQRNLGGGWGLVVLSVFKTAATRLVRVWWVRFPRAPVGFASGRASYLMRLPWAAAELPGFCSCTRSSRLSVLSSRIARRLV